MVEKKVQKKMHEGGCFLVLKPCIFRERLGILIHMKEGSRLIFLLILGWSDS